MIITFLFEFLSEMIRRTPVYVWVILVLLLQRGLYAAKDNVLSLPRMMIFPAVFIVWGLWDVVFDFAYPAASAAAFIALTAAGAPAGYVLYNRFRYFFQKDGVLYRSGTYVTLVVTVVNFVIKYALNVGMSISPGVCGSLYFNLFYSIADGLLVGLSIGGVIQAYRAMSAAQVV